MRARDIPEQIIVVNQSQNVDGCGCGGCLTLILVLMVLSAVSSCMGFA
jgi:hypothetical protein